MTKKENPQAPADRVLQNFSAENPGEAFENLSPEDLTEAVADLLTVAANPAEEGEEFEKIPEIPPALLRQAILNFAPGAAEFVKDVADEDLADAAQEAIEAFQAGAAERILAEAAEDPELAAALKRFGFDAKDLRAAAPFEGGKSSLAVKFLLAIICLIMFSATMTMDISRDQARSAYSLSMAEAHTADLRWERSPRHLGAEIRFADADFYLLDEDHSKSFSSRPIDYFDYYIEKNPRSKEEWNTDLDIWVHGTGRVISREIIRDHDTGKKYIALKTHIQRRHPKTYQAKKRYKKRKEIANDKERKRDDLENDYNKAKSEREKFETQLVTAKTDLLAAEADLLAAEALPTTVTSGFAFAAATDYTSNVVLAETNLENYKENVAGLGISLGEAHDKENRLLQEYNDAKTATTRAKKRANQARDKYNKINGNERKTPGKKETRIVIVSLDELD
jgi:hypothetical protein